jgi:hypothetical protein
VESLNFLESRTEREALNILTTAVVKDVMSGKKIKMKLRDWALVLIPWTIRPDRDLRIPAIFAYVRVSSF